MDGTNKMINSETNNEVLSYAIEITKKVINSIIPKSIDCVGIVTKVIPTKKCYVPNGVSIYIKGTGAFSDVLQLGLQVAIPDYFMFFDDFDRKEFEKYFVSTIKQSVIELYVEFTRKVKEIYEDES